MTPSIVILTFNCASTIAPTLEAAARVSPDVHVIDSFSSDGTLSVVRVILPEARVYSHKFDRYDDQRNWAIANIASSHEWQLHLDADEVVSESLRDEIRALPELPIVDGYHIPRLVRFHGADILHGGMYPIYHLRLFRKGAGRCETRRYDQHFIVDGPTARLRNPMIDRIDSPLLQWAQQQLKWAVDEAVEVVQPLEGAIHGRWLNGTPQQRKRLLRESYYVLPPFFRAFALFCYRLVVRGGFLDGIRGLTFYVVQTLIVRLFIDACIIFTKRRLALTVGQRVEERF